MAPALVLYQPDIAQNTGTLLRLAACMNTPIHVIHPTGFAFSEPKLRRAGMDYLDHAQLHEHDSFAHFRHWQTSAGLRLVLLTTKAHQMLYDFTFTPNDLLMLGRESAGVPDEVAALADATLRIPMAPARRSLNMAISGALALGEAMRQTATLPQQGASSTPMM